MRLFPQSITAYVCLSLGALLISACTRPSAAEDLPIATAVPRTAVVQATDIPPLTVLATVHATPRVATTSPIVENVASTSADTRADACAAAVDAFIPPGTALFRAAQEQVTILDAYVQRTAVADVDQSQVEVLFADLPTIPVPTCVDEAPEIINYLGLMRDTLYPAFVEIKVELATGNPDAQSYARVQGWIGVLRTFEREINTRLAALPGAVTAVRARRRRVLPNPTPPYRPRLHVPLPPNLHLHRSVVAQLTPFWMTSTSMSTAPRPFTLISRSMCRGARAQ